MSSEHIPIQDRKRRARALLEGGRLQEAKSAYEEICRQAPQDAEACFLLGAVCGQLGLLDEVISCSYKALALKPDYADAHFNLAQAYLGKAMPREAMSSYRRVLQLSPNYLAALLNLGTLLQNQGNLEEAEACFRRALTSSTNNADVHYNLANVLSARGVSKAAEESYRAALGLQPDHVGAWVNLGVLLQSQGSYEQAMSCFGEALRVKPDHLEAWIDQSALLQMQGLYAEAEVAIRQALQIAPASNQARSGLLFNMCYYATEPEALFHEHREWDRHHAQPLPRLRIDVTSADPERRLRIGYVSPDMRTHSVAYFFEPLLANHDKAVVETFCYAGVARPDAVTTRLQSLAGNWRNISGISPARVAEQIREDRIDILVDLAGHTGHDLLLVFARKPAPIQVTYLGYPNTTGMQAMDYRFTDAWADPPGQTEQFHTETLWRLPRGFLCYRAREEASIPVSPSPIEKTGYITFGSFNNLSKVTPDVVALWVRILDAVPNSRILLKSAQLQDRGTCVRYRELFTGRGIAEERVDLRGRMLDPAAHLTLYGQVDIALDTFPYNGTTTTCEALWMGVPVITLAGRMHAGRVGVSLLSHVGLTECIAVNEDDYVRLAVQLAHDPEKRRWLRAELRSRLAASPLCDGRAFAREVEAAYRQMWRKWCVAHA